MKSVMAKLGNMRKVVDWVVYPQRGDKKIIIQCDKRICMFDPDTGKGILSGSHNYPGFHTLQMQGATAIIVPPEVIKAATEAQPKSGDKIGTVLEIA